MRVLHSAESKRTNVRSG